VDYLKKLLELSQERTRLLKECIRILNKYVDECVIYLKRFLEEGHIPGLTSSGELLTRFREKCVEEFGLEAIERLQEDLALALAFRPYHRRKQTLFEDIERWLKDVERQLEAIKCIFDLHELLPIEAIEIRSEQEKPMWHPCTFAFLVLCRELGEEGLLKIPAAEAYERFDRWLREFQVNRERGGRS